MKKAFLSVLLSAVLLFSTVAFSGCDTSNHAKYVIGICQLAEHPALDKATEGFQRALKEKLGDDVAFSVKNAQGEQSNCTTIANGFVTSNVSLIMANGTNAVKAAAEVTDTIPVIGTSVTDYVASGLIASDSRPGANVTGASDGNPVEVQVELMKTLCPSAKIVGIVYCSAEENSKVQADEAKAAFEKGGYTVKIYTVADSNEISSTVTKACGEVDAFYEPTDNLIASNVSTMANICTANKKPVIVAEESMCKNGFLATYSISYEELGYRAGLMAYEILVNGKDPAEMPIFHFETSDLTLIVNEDCARELGIEIPDSLKK